MGALTPTREEVVAALNALGIEYNYTRQPVAAWFTIVVMDVWHWTSLVVLLCYLLYSAYTYIRAAAHHIHQMSYIGLGATEFRILMIVWACVASALGLQEPLLGRMTGIDIAILSMGGMAVLGLGYKAVMDKYLTRNMTSQELGLTNEHYDLWAPYSTRITPTGEFVHGAPWAAGRIGRAELISLFVGDLLCHSPFRGQLLNASELGLKAVEIGLRPRNRCLGFVDARLGRGLSGLGNSDRRRSLPPVGRR